MGRPIDEEKIINIVAYECGEWSGLAKEIEKQIRALPTAEPQWIPCSEQMPVEEVAVWVTIAGHDVIIRKEGETIEDAIDRISKTRWVTQEFLAEDGWYGADGYPMVVRPIAWMPLEKPKAYGEE